METDCTIQLFAHGRWLDVASLEIKGGPEHGIRTPTYAAYTLAYAIDNLGRHDAAALAWAFPVQLDAFARPTWPAFLVDLLPQGYGRAELLRHLGLPETAAAEADWPLLLAAAAGDAEREILEYVKRDIANIVLGNKDNHGRNTAVQRAENGAIQLSPIFDFAPMLLHPDGIARRMRWERDDGGAPLWASVVAQCREAAGLALDDLPVALRSMAAAVAALPELAIAEGVDADLVARLQPTMRDVAEQLARL